jgi:hypothetical protein
MLMGMNCDAKDDVAVKRGRIVDSALARSPYSRPLRLVEVSTLSIGQGVPELNERKHAYNASGKILLLRL